MKSIALQLRRHRNAHRLVERAHDGQPEFIRVPAESV
jgi:hypothetical protein